MIALDNLCLLALSGTDVPGFLQGQLTCDVRAASTRHALLGGYCNIKGRLMAVFYLVDLADGRIGLILPCEIAASVQALLEKYGRFSKIRGSITEGSLFGMMAPAPEGWIALPGNTRALHIGPLKDSAHGELGLWQAADMAGKIPWIYTGSQDLLLPQPVGLVDLGGVAFDKGCYLGQEIIARMHYRGQARKHSYHLRGTGALPEPGAEICRDSRVIGHILYAQAEDTGFIVLASMAEEDTQGPLVLQGTEQALMLT